MDSNEKNLTFKTVFKGFDKKNVVEYIRTLSAKYDNEIKEKTSEAESAKEKLSQMEKKVAELEIRVTESVSENARLKGELDSADTELITLRKQTAELTEKLAAKEADTTANDEKAFLESEVERLTRELSAVMAENEKAKLEIADIVIKAEQISKRIRDEAIANANEEKAAIERQIVSRKSELMGINGEIERMKSVFTDLYKKYVKE